MPKKILIKSLILAFFIFPFLNMTSPAALALSADEVLKGASSYTGQLSLDPRHYNQAGFILKEWGKSELFTDSAGAVISKEYILVWENGEVTVNYADLVASQKQSVDAAVYGRLCFAMPSDVVSADGNYRFIIKTGNNPAVFYNNLPEGGFFIPLTPLSSQTYHPLNNPLQKSVIAWRTSSGWKKTLINPKTEADAILDRAMPNSALEKLELDTSHYDQLTGILYEDIDMRSGELTTPDGVKVNKAELLSWSTGALIVRYADTLASQRQQDSSGNTVYGYLRLEIPSGAVKTILKPADSDAYFEIFGNSFFIPLIKDASKPYDAQNNPLVPAAIAWQNSSGGWIKLALIPVAQAEQVMSNALTSSLPLNLAPSIYNSQGELYADIVNKSGNLKAKDNQTVLTRYNVPVWAGGVLELNYAETLAGQITGQGFGYVGLSLPGDMVGDDGSPRCILRVGEKEAHFYPVNGDILWVPFIARTDMAYHFQDNPLAEVEVAWRTAEGWKKAKIKPNLEYRKPQLKSKFPYAADNRWFDENSLSPAFINGKERYFIRTVWADDDGNLKLAEDFLSLMRLCQVVSSGGSQTSMLDDELIDYVQALDSDARAAFIDKYLFIRDNAKKEAVLQLPVKKLRPQTEYQATFSSGLVFYENGEGNDAVTWSFTTMAIPHVSGISTGSIGEDYDTSEPLIIKGDFFYGNNIVVKFNDVAASRVEIGTDKDGRNYLKVYLPSGSSRLKTGIYDITVMNNNNAQYQAVLAGRLSVVPAGKGSPPQEGEKVRDVAYYGEVREQVNRSEAVLTLKSSYRERAYIYLDLEEIMPGIREKKIKFSAYDWPIIRELSVAASLTEVIFRNVRINREIDDTEILIGKASAEMVRGMSYQLPLYKVRSDFVALKAENIGFESIEMKMFFDTKNARNIKVLRYDETYRRFYEVPSRLDYLNGEAVFTTIRPGIFVLIEP